MLDASFGLDQGFDVYDSPARKFGSRDSRIKERPAGAVVDAALAWLDGRDHVTPDDVCSVLHAVMRHRLILSYDALADRVSPDQVIDEIITQVAVG